MVTRLFNCLAKWIFCLISHYLFGSISKFGFSLALLRNSSKNLKLRGFEIVSDVVSQGIHRSSYRCY